MNTMMSKNLKSKIHLSVGGMILLGTSLLTPAGLALADGGNSGGGGDASEARVDEIRADILKWINGGGAQGLRLPNRLTLETYRAGMTTILTPHSVVVGFVTTAQESDPANTDPELKVSVNGQPKTCRGFVSTKDSLSHILCNSERFSATGEIEQYRLVHHEYAGLAGIEQNIGASSDYEISDQLTKFVRAETVWRLAIVPQGLPAECAKGVCSLYNYMGDYALLRKSKSTPAGACSDRFSVSLDGTHSNLTLGNFPSNTSTVYGVSEPNVSRFQIQFQTSTGLPNAKIVVSRKMDMNYDSSVLALVSKAKIDGTMPGGWTTADARGVYPRIELRPMASGDVQWVGYEEDTAHNRYVPVANCVYTISPSIPWNH